MTNLGELESIREYFVQRLRWSEYTRPYPGQGSHRDSRDVSAGLVEALFCDPTGEPSRDEKPSGLALALKCNALGFIVAS